MRGPACFTNCSPAESQVTINANTYAIGANEIGWKIELFGSGGKTISVLPESRQVQSFGAAYLPAKAALSLAYPPVSAHSVEITLQGTATQRPLIGLDGHPSDGESAVMNVHDFFVVGSTVYLNFDVVSTDKVYVRYVASPGMSAASVGTTGMTRSVSIAVSASSAIEIGHWLATPLGTEGEEPVMLAPGDDQYGYATDGSETTATQFTDSAGTLFLVSDYDSVAECLAAAVASEVELDWVSMTGLYAPPAGWCKADGFTRYPVSQYSALYSHLDAMLLLAECPTSLYFIISKIVPPGPLGAANLVLIKA